MADTDRDWQRWGEKDPYYAVLTDPKFRKNELTGHLDYFFASGEQDVEHYLELARRHFPDLKRRRALDFGCGVGRLALPLARRFDQVVAVDISPAMLSEAEANAAAQGCTNLDFVESDDGLSRVSGQFDYVNSKIVLQHIPVERGMRLIQKMISLLAPGGVASLHFTVDRQESRLRRVAYSLQRRLPMVHSFANLAKGRGFGDPLMQINEYPLLDVLALFDKGGISFPLIGIEQNVAWRSVHLIGQRAA